MWLTTGDADTLFRSQRCTGRTLANLHRVVLSTRTSTSGTGMPVRALPLTLRLPSRFAADLLAHFPFRRGAFRGWPAAVHGPAICTRFVCSFTIPRLQLLTRSPLPWRSQSRWSRSSPRSCRATLSRSRPRTPSGTPRGTTSRSWRGGRGCLRSRTGSPSRPTSVRCCSGGGRRRLCNRAVRAQDRRLPEGFTTHR